MKKLFVGILGLFLAVTMVCSASAYGGEPGRRDGVSEVSQIGTVDLSADTSILFRLQHRENFILALNVHAFEKPCVVNKRSVFTGKKVETVSAKDIVKNWTNGVAVKNSKDEILTDETVLAWIKKLSCFTCSEPGDGLRT